MTTEKHTSWANGETHHIHGQSRRKSEYTLCQANGYVWKYSETSNDYLIESTLPIDTVAETGGIHGNE